MFLRKLLSCFVCFHIPQPLRSIIDETTLWSETTKPLSSRLNYFPVSILGLLHLSRYWKCNFPMNPHVRLLDAWSVGRAVLSEGRSVFHNCLSRRGSYTSNAPIGALVHLLIVTKSSLILTQLINMYTYTFDMHISAVKAVIIKRSATAVVCGNGK